MYKAPGIFDLASVAEATLAPSTRTVSICKDTKPDTDGTLGLGFLGPGSNPRPGTC